MQCLYSYLKNIDILESEYLKINTELINNQLFLRIYKKSFVQESPIYLGISFIDLETLNKEIDPKTFVFENIKIYPTPTLKPLIITTVELMLINYLITEVHKEQLKPILNLKKISNN